MEKYSSPVFNKDGTQHLSIGDLLAKAISVSANMSLIGSELTGPIAFTGATSVTLTLPVSTTWPMAIIGVNDSSVSQTIALAGGVFIGPSGTNHAYISIPPNTMFTIIPDNANAAISFMSFATGQDVAEGTAAASFVTPAALAQGFGYPVAWPLQVRYGGAAKDYAILGYATQMDGVHGHTENNAHAGVRGTSDVGTGVVGGSQTNTGTAGMSISGWGVYGHSVSAPGVVGKSDSSNGVHGESETDTGVYGIAKVTNKAGVYGTNNVAGGSGVSGGSSAGIGVVGSSDTGTGALGSSNSGFGVHGSSSSSFGVAGYSVSSTGVYGHSQTGNAGYFEGTVVVTDYCYAKTPTVGDKSTKVATTEFVTDSVASLALPKPPGTYFYVDETNGLDSYDGSETHPWRTLQHAYDVVSQYATPGGITIHVADGDYGPVVIGPSFINTLFLVGNAANPDACRINATAVGGRGIGISGATDVNITGFKISSYFENIGVSSSNVTVRDCHLTGPTYVHTSSIGINASGYVFFAGTIKYSGDADSVITVTQGGQALIGYHDSVVSVSCNFQFLDTPDMKVATFMALGGGTIYVVSSPTVTFTGSVTGNRYFIVTNGVIDVFGGGESRIPGSLDGVTSTGGQYR